jgi:nucleotide-binding universal stress UspA family protein
VLVPIDGSEFSLRALPTARALAQRLGADVQSISIATDDDDAGRLRTISAAMLDMDADDERVSVVVGGDPADVIVRRADELAPSVVCMSTHGRGRLSGALIGSVARSVVQRSSEPVVVLGPSADNPGWTPRPRRWPEPLSVARIVACVDGSATSEQILPVAAAWATSLDMSLTILTVAEDVPLSVDDATRDRGYGPDDDADAYIEDLVTTWRKEIANVDGEVVRDPISPASGLHHHLDERPAGLVAVTTNARSGVDRLFLGATAASLVHASVSPCLVAPVRP